MQLAPDLADIATWVTDNPVVIALAAALVISLVVLHTAPRAPFGKRQDPQRLFTAGQRREVFARCDSRCEQETVLGLRCGREATQGDHWYPHSRGGATTTANLVGLCARCNRRKSAHIPTRAATLRLGIRRRRYWPSGVDRSAGAWY